MRTLARFLIGTLLCTSAAFAQFETAEVLGTVHDASGAEVHGAAVTLTNEETGVQRKTVSDDSGAYDFFDVQIGHYTITAELTGFETFKTTNVRVDVNARQRVDITLQVGAMTQSVEVQSAAEVLETDTSEHGQVVHTQQIVELPLNGRDYSDLALLATNVHRSPMAVLFSPTGTPREAAFNVNGMRSTYNDFLLDGLDNNAYSPSNQGYSSQVVQPSPDAIAEFKVITSNFSAEYGRVGGGVVNTALRAGTNAFRGTAYEFLRNTDLNAVGFFPSAQKPTLQRNQFGFTIGGPFIKNKLFFFADYEGYRQLQRYLNFDSLPTGAERTGVLPVAVYDPLNHTVYPANTQIPVSALNPFAAQVLGGLPSNTGSGVSNNYSSLLLIRDYSDKYDAKIDYHISDK
ncbi:MAG: TonB-dependent receptor, partial [Acidobacteriaceae bacterium]|nr:TonB-dependent receptor [Acidobacteriaceae bacterium]